MTEHHFDLLIRILCTACIYLDLCFPTRLSHSRPPLTEVEVTLAPCSVCAEVAQCLPPLTQSLHACWCEMQSHSLLWMNWPEWSGRGSYSKDTVSAMNQETNSKSHNWVAQHLDWRNVIQFCARKKAEFTFYLSAFHFEAFCWYSTCNMLRSKISVRLRVHLRNIYNINKHTHKDTIANVFLVGINPWWLDSSGKATSLSSGSHMD